MHALLRIPKPIILFRTATRSSLSTHSYMASQRSDHLQYDHDHSHGRGGRPENNDSNTSGMTEDHKRLVHENRMDRPPYARPAGHEREPFKAVYGGSCFCDRVKFEISRERPLDAKFCHCPTCQRLHGAPFQWVPPPPSLPPFFIVLGLTVKKAAIFHKTDVLFTHGQDELIYWNPGEKSQEYILPCKISCRHCRAPIMDEGRNMLLLYPTLVHFQDLKQKRIFYPTYVLYSTLLWPLLEEDNKS